MATAKVIIAGQNNIGSAVKSAQSDLSSFSQVAQKAGDVLKKAFTVTAVIAAVKKLGDSLSSCFEDFNEADRKYRQLQLTLGKGDAYASVTENIRKLGKMTLEGKDSVESMVSELAALGKTPEEINRISDAAVALSNVTGRDLNSSMTTLLNTYRGTTTQLNKLGIDTSNLTKEQLANGAAVDLVTEKLYALSEAMAKDDSSQHIKNIQDNLGDMKQSIGDLVNFSISPLLAKLDEFTTNAVSAFDGFIQRVKVVLGNLPVVLEHLWTAIKGGLSNLFSIEGFKNLVQNISNVVLSRIKLIGDAMANLMSLVQTMAQYAIEGIGDYAMYWITDICDSLGINLSEVINSIGGWLTESPVGRFVDNLLSKVVNGLRLIGGIIGNIPSIVKIVMSNIGTIVSSFLDNIPKAIGQLFVGLADKVAWFVVKSKNDMLQGIEDVVNSAGERIRDTWLGRFLGLGDKLADFDIGVDRSSELDLAARTDMAFGKVRGYFGNIGEDLSEMAKEINALLSPTFDKFVSDNSETIGQTMAKWTAKSSDEYYVAAKRNFKDIGSFLSDWGETFLSDMGDDWEGLKTSLSSVFGDAFGEDFDAFLTWFRPFMEEKLAVPTTTQPQTIPATSGTDDDEITISTFIDDFGTRIGGFISDRFGASDTQGSAAGSAVMDMAVESLGEAGTVAKELATNMATMGPVIGAIVTAVKYVFEGFAEVFGDGLNEFIEYGLEPLREIGRVIGGLLLPILENLMPLVQQSAESLIGVFDLIGAVLSPILQMIGSALAPVISLITNVLETLKPVLIVFVKIVVTITGTIQYVAQTLQHWVAVLMNWLASINLMGWRPFSGLQTDDPGTPGSYKSYIKNKWAEIDSAFDSQSSSSTGTASTSTAVSSASYQGATQVTINIYQQAPVIGDGGMKAFAHMIRDQFNELDYYGVTT